MQIPNIQIDVTPRAQEWLERFADLVSKLPLTAAGGSAMIDELHTALTKGEFVAIQDVAIACQEEDATND